MPETELKTDRCGEVGLAPGTPREGWPRRSWLRLLESLRVHSPSPIHLVHGMHVYNFNDRSAAGALHVKIVRPRVLGYRVLC